MSLTRDDETTFSLTWRDNSDSEDSYIVESKAGGEDYVVLSNEPAGSTSYIHSGLTLNETYSYRVKATGPYGESDYSNEVFALLYERSTVRDIDGNIYQTIRSGDQWWMAENLRVSKYRDGSSVEYATDTTSHEVTGIGIYWIYNNNSNDELDTYGALYNWHAVSDSRNIAPEGWHIPTDAEWQELIDNLGGEDVAGDYMKEAGTIHWEDDEGSTNISGFSALPGGRYSYSEGWWGWGGSWIDGEPGFYRLGRDASFWSATEDVENGGAIERFLSSDISGIYRGVSEKENGFSVRCVKD